MEDVFEKLKSDPATGKKKGKHSSTENLSIIKNIAETQKGTRRTSLPQVDSINKHRSSSPKLASSTKSVKVRVERKRLDNVSIQNLEEKASPDKAKKASDENKENSKTNRTQPSGSPKKLTPTKAAQKLFAPTVESKSSPSKNSKKLLRDFKLKRCKVRLPRQNLLKLKRSVDAKLKKEKSAKLSPKAGEKRASGDNNLSPKDSPSPSKKARPNTSFFIKIAPTTPKLDKKNHKSQSGKKVASAFSKADSAKSNSKKKLFPAKTKITTKVEKLKIGELKKKYGKKWFNCKVKIKRCTHPLMLIYESNERARNLKSQRYSKSKNLSVSFKDQVEIFGDSDVASDIEEGTDERKKEKNDNLSSTSHAAAEVGPIPTSIVTPIGLKKVENGKVVDDIVLDTSLFMDPKCVDASTPFVFPDRRKREKTILSPLKGDGSPSAQSEKLKLANEKLPPSALRRLNVEDEEEDDEDDDCEYIVPIDIPQRRISRSQNPEALSEEEEIGDKETDIEPSYKDPDVESSNKAPDTETHKKEPDVEADKKQSEVERVDKESDVEVTSTSPISKISNDIDAATVVDKTSEENDSKNDSQVDLEKKEEEAASEEQSKISSDNEETSKIKVNGNKEEEGENVENDADVVNENNIEEKIFDENKTEKDESQDEKEELQSNSLTKEEEEKIFNLSDSFKSAMETSSKEENEDEDMSNNSTVVNKNDSSDAGNLDEISSEVETGTKEMESSIITPNNNSSKVNSKDDRLSPVVPWNSIKDLKDEDLLAPVDEAKVVSEIVVGNGSNGSAEHEKNDLYPDSDMNLFVEDDLNLPSSSGTPANLGDTDSQGSGNIENILKETFLEMPDLCMSKEGSSVQD